MVEQYKALFSGGVGDDFTTKWGWYSALYTLSGESFLNMDEVTEKSVGTVFTHLCYLQDLAHKKKNDNI